MIYVTTITDYRVDISKEIRVMKLSKKLAQTRDEWKETIFRLRL